jgi:hypothetical protein
MRSLKVADVTFTDIDFLHRKITSRGSNYQANRVVALLSKMFQLAIRWQWRADNPCKGVERNQERKRHRYLDGSELERADGTFESGGAPFVLTPGDHVFGRKFRRN